MPELFSRSTVSRRGFGITSLGMFGAAVFLSASDSEAQEANDSLRVALLSDTHVAADPAEAFRGFKPFDNLKAVVEQLVPQSFQAALICGDAARLNGQTADYEQLKQLLMPIAEKMPIAVGLGNHDDRANASSVFQNPTAVWNSADVSGKRVLVLEHVAVRLVVLDSLLYVNQVAGLLGKTQREWLARFLTEADGRPTAIFVHHTLGDEDGELLDADRLFQLVEPHRNVKAIFFGHSHRYEVKQRGRIHLVNLLALGYNFDDNQPVGWMDGVFHAKGCDLTLQALAGNPQHHGQKLSLAW